MLAYQTSITKRLNTCTIQVIIACLKHTQAGARVTQRYYCICALPPTIHTVMQGVSQ
jgi:hypothetical protein